MEERLGQQSEGAPAVTDMEKLYGKFNRRLAQAVAIAAAAIIPVGLIISSVFGGWRGFAGAMVGFGVASLYSMASFASLKWALKKPVDVMPTILMATMWGRLLVLAGILFGLTYVHALNSVAMLFSFLALFIAYTAVEVVYAYRAFGVIMKAGKESRKT